MKTKLTLTCCLLALFVTAANAQKPDPAKPDTWNTYTVDGAGFSIALPLRPAMHLNFRYRDEWDKERKTLQLGAYADGVVYTVFVVENPSPKVSLQEFIGEFTSASANSERKVDRFVGKVFASADQDDVSQYFATEDNLYAFRAFGPRLDDARATKFFSSLSFSNAKGALAVHDGPGDPFVPVVQPGSAEVEPADKVFTGKEVTRKVRLGMRAEPRYTEEARQNGISGTVILKCIFASDGSVKDIKITAGLPYGLTEKAIAAARKMKFIPAMKDGKYVSMWIQLEYNFNLY